MFQRIGFSSSSFVFWSLRRRKGRTHHIPHILIYKDELLICDSCTMEQMVRFTCSVCHLGFTTDDFVVHIRTQHDHPIINTTLDKVEGDRVKIRYRKRNPFKTSFINTLANSWINGLIMCDDQVFLLEVQEFYENMSVWISVVGFSAVNTSPYSTSLCYVEENEKFPTEIMNIKSWRGIVEPTTVFTAEIPKFTATSDEIWRTFKHNGREELYWNLNFKIHKSSETRNEIINLGGGLHWRCKDDLNIWPDSFFPFLSPGSAEYKLNMMSMQNMIEEGMNPQTTKELHKHGDPGGDATAEPSPSVSPIVYHLSARDSTSDHAGAATLRVSAATEATTAKNSTAHSSTPPPLHLSISVDTSIPSAEMSSTLPKHVSFADEVQIVQQARSDQHTTVSTASNDMIVMQNMNEDMNPPSAEELHKYDDSEDDAKESSPLDGPREVCRLSAQDSTSAQASAALLQQVAATAEAAATKNSTAHLTTLPPLHPCISASTKTSTRAERSSTLPKHVTFADDVPLAPKPRSDQHKNSATTSNDMIFMQNMIERMTPPTTNKQHKYDDSEDGAKEPSPHAGPSKVCRSSARALISAQAAAAALQRVAAAAAEANATTNYTELLLTPPPLYPFISTNNSIPDKWLSTHPKQVTFADEVPVVPKAMSDRQKNVSTTSNNSKLLEIQSSPSNDLGAKSISEETIIAAASSLPPSSTTSSSATTSGNVNVHLGQGLTGKYAELMERLTIGETVSNVEIELIQKGFVLLVRTLDNAAKQIVNQGDSYQNTSF